MAYRLIWSKSAAKKLKRLDLQVFFEIMNGLYKLHEHPEDFGKPLSGTLKNNFRLRIGDYRILYTVDREKQLVSIFDLGHRKDIYG